jgi:hypothetical protein
MRGRDAISWIKAFWKPGPQQLAQAFQFSFVADFSVLR